MDYNTKNQFDEMVDVMRECKKFMAADGPNYSTGDVIAMARSIIECKVAAIICGVLEEGFDRLDGRIAMMADLLPDKRAPKTRAKK